MSAPTRNVLLFAAKLGYQTHSFDEAARKLGVNLIFVTDRCHKLDDPWGDRAIPVHFKEPEEAARATVNSLHGNRPDGVMAIGDAPTVTEAFVARALGIPYNHPAAVEACRSKLRMREVFESAGLPSPWFRAMPLSPLPEPALAGVRYPCVLKPLSLSASQGVMRANNRDEFLTGAERLRRLLASPDVRMQHGDAPQSMLVEEYLPGQEVAVEGLLHEGRLRVLAIFDKPDPLEGPFFEETIYVTPSRQAPAAQLAIEKCVADAVRALGLTAGPVHAEFRINEAGVWPLEVAPRPIGGLCARALRFESRRETTPVALEELLLRHALGMETDDYAREASASGVLMIPVPASGVLTEVKGEAEARKVPGITDCNITARLHDYIAAWPEGSSYLGFLFARAKTPAEAEQALRAAHGKLNFKIVKPLPVRHPVSGQVRETA